MSLETKLKHGLAELNLELSQTQIQQLLDYVALLDKWNKAYNLTAVRDPLEMVTVHILDSLAVAPLVKGHARVIDVGTGPGLPGIPLAIALPDHQFTLLDSLGKRVRFLTQVVHGLKLQNVTPIQSRVEQHQVEQPYDAIISRAFASINDMLAWCGHLGEHFLAMKGVESPDELEHRPEGYTIAAIHPLRVPGLIAQRHLVELVKSS